MKLCAEKPCPTCPWLKSSTVGGEDIPGFNMVKMRGLADTVPDRGSDQDGMFKIMACHHSKEGEEYACAGYIYRHGWQNINVRLMAAFNNLDIGKVYDNCDTDGNGYYADFYQMLDAYEGVNSEG